MNGRAFFTLFFALVVIFSLSAVDACDVNMTDSEDMVSCDDSSIQTDNDTLLKSSDSNDLHDGAVEGSSKNSTEFTSPTSNVYYAGEYKVTLKDSDSSALLANKTVKFVINGASYNAVTNGNGVASVNLKLNPGTYTASMLFAGDDDYKNSTLTSSFSMLATIKANDVTKYYKGSAKYSASFLNSQGNALTNTYVTITVNGKSQTVKTDKAGVISIPVNLKPGTYKITASNPITGYRLTTTFTVLSTISATKLKNVEGKKFKVKFLKSNGKALAKKYVKIKFKGKTKKVKTDSRGYAYLSLKKVKKGTYKVVCRNRDGLSKTFNVKVYKRKVSTKLTARSCSFYPNNKRLIKAKLSTALGSSNKGKVIKIKVNGKTYSRKTGAGGVVNLVLPSLKKGVYKVQYKYDGNKYFKPSKSTKSLTVFDTTRTSLKVRGTKSFGYGAGTSLKVFYNAGGVPIAKKKVTLNIAGKIYRKTTNSKGIASIPINLDIGNHAVDYKVEGDSIFDGTSGSFNIKVFERSPSKVLWKSGSKYGDDAQHFKIRIVDSKGKPVSGGGTVKFTIGGKKHTVKVPSNAYVKVKTRLPFGKYKVSVKFKGNNKYLPGESAKSVTVKLSKFRNGINEKHAKALSAYLKSSRNCKVGTKALKKLVKSLTKGKTTKADKARAIFNYVRDTLTFSYYYNTKYGVSDTFKHKSGNCVDHSHILVAMYRTAKIPARYVHGKCHFSDGDFTGHVWVQVKIGKKWVCADAINDRNSLGKITNWDVDHYSLQGKYASLPF